MATSLKLSLSFLGSNGNSINHSFNYSKAKEDIVDANVKALMEGMVANGDIYENPPAAIKSAKIVKTEESAIDLS